MTTVEPKKKRSRIVGIIIFDIIIITAIIIYFGIVRPHQLSNLKINGIYLPKATEVSDFTLTDNHGNPFTNDTLKGHWTMMFFGFTNCAMVCPTTMDALNKMYQSLQKELPENQLPLITLVSVDPERDTVEKMNDYVSSFNPHFVGARAEIPQTIALEKQFHIAAAKMEADGQGAGHYSINHSAEIILINPEGQVQAYFSYPHQPEKMAADYKLIFKTFKGRTV
jgi:protein SCO1/2